MLYRLLKSSILARPGALLLVMTLSGCVIGTGGVTHTVKSGETLWRICRTYDVELQDGAEINDIRNHAEIKAGSKLFIPGASRVKRIPPYSSTAARQESKDDGPRSIQVHKGMFEWPVHGSLISGFGLRNGGRHDGIDIRA